MGLESTEENIESLLSAQPEIEESDGSKKIDEAKAKFFDDERKKYLEMESQFVELLTALVGMQKERERQKGWFKSIFFTVVMLLFGVLMLTPVILLFKFSNIVNNISIMMAVFASLVELVTAIMVLPNIIANYLFNKEEDGNSTKVIQDLREYHENRAKHFE